MVRRNHLAVRPRCRLRSRLGSVDDRRDGSRPTTLDCHAERVSDGNTVVGGSDPSCDYDNMQQNGIYFHDWVNARINNRTGWVRAVRRLWDCRLSAKSGLPTIPRNFPGSGRSCGNDWYVTEPL